MNDIIKIPVGIAADENSNLYKIDFSNLIITKIPKNTAVNLPTIDIKILSTSSPNVNEKKLELLTNNNLNISKRFINPSKQYIRNNFGASYDFVRKKSKSDKKEYWGGLLHSIIQADLMDIKEIYVIEFGIYKGEGMDHLCEAAKYFTNVHNIKINIVGFDTFTGLTKLQSVVDHPEIWDDGQFYSNNKEEILNNSKNIYPHVEFIEGDCKETICKFPFKKECPIGFVSIDLDLYSSTKNALKIFDYEKIFYLPCVSVYFDDISALLTYNPYCGEQLAINEFNNEHEKRKIVKRCDTSLPDFYTLHILDHPVLTGEQKTKFKFEMGLV